MIIPDAKKRAMVILSKLRPDGSTSDQEVKPEAVDDTQEGLMSAAEDIMQAIQDKSPQGLMTALRAFLDQCESGEGE